MRRGQRMVSGFVCGVALLGASGCQSGMPPKRTIASREPSLAMPGDPQPGVVVQKPVGGSVAFVERHPLLYKPKEMYESSGNNTLVKVAGATLVGIPVGIFGELRQIVVGRPASATY
jgi:hypothetical protein